MGRNTVRHDGTRPGRYAAEPARRRRRWRWWRRRSGRRAEPRHRTSKKKAAANTIENELEPDTAKAAKWADAATTAAVGGFEGWATAAGLKTVETTWDNQVKNLLARLASEKTALRGAALSFGQQEIDTRARIAGVRPSSRIEQY